MIFRAVDHYAWIDDGISYLRHLSRSMIRTFRKFRPQIQNTNRLGLHTMRACTRLAILECDTALPGIAKKYGGYGGLFKVLLNTGARLEGYSRVEDVLDISIHHIEDDPDNYPNIADIDALLLTGSRKTPIHSKNQALTPDTRARFIHGSSMDFEIG